MQPWVGKESDWRVCLCVHVRMYVRHEVALIKEKVCAPSESSECWKGLCDSL